MNNRSPETIFQGWRELKHSRKYTVGVVCSVMLDEGLRIADEYDRMKRELEEAKRAGYITGIGAERPIE